MDQGKEKDTAAWGGKGGEEDDDEEERGRKVKRNNEEGREKRITNGEEERMRERQSKKGKGSLNQQGGGAGAREMENGWRLGVKGRCWKVGEEAMESLEHCRQGENKKKTVRKMENRRERRRRLCTEHIILHRSTCIAR